MKPATLKLLMRHKSIETALKYYVSQDADDVADELWEEFKPTTAKRAGNERPGEKPGNTSGNSRPKSC